MPNALIDDHPHGIPRRQSRAILRLSIGLIGLSFVFFFSCKQKSGSENSTQIAIAEKVADSALAIMSGPTPAKSPEFIQRSFSRLGNDPRIQWIRLNTIRNYYANYVIDTLKQHMYIDTMFVMLRQMPYGDEYPRTILSYAILLQDEQHYEAAFKELYDGSIMAKKQADYCGLTDFYNHMGVIRYRQERYQAAIPYLKQALKDNNQCRLYNDFTYAFIMKQSLLNTTALCFEKVNQVDSAIHYYQAALSFVKSKAKIFPEKTAFIQTAEGVISGNLGGAYAKLGQDDQAVHFLKADIAINDRPGFAIEDAQTAKIKLVTLYLDRQNYNEAAHWLNELTKDMHSGRGSSMMHTEIRRDWLGSLARLEKERNRPDEAYQNLLAFHKLSDSLDKEKDQLIRTNIDQAFVYNDQQHLLTEITRNDRLKTGLLFVVIIGLVVVLVAAAIARVHLRRSKTLVNLLKDTNRKLENSMQDLDSSREENLQILKIVAHDLRNPIGAITSASQLLLADTGQSDQQRELAEMINECSQNAIHLVTDLLDGNNRDLAKTQIDISVLLQDTVDLMQHHAQAKQQTLELSAAAHNLFIDKAKISRVVSNLINNAIKFSSRASTITIIGQAQTDQYMISIQDQGIGIPTELQEKLFDFFTDTRRPGTDGEKSYGLGLAICRKIVQEHQGKIWIESKPEKGTTFFISLPLS